jgi:hypothetical protein
LNSAIDQLTVKQAADLLARKAVTVRTKQADESWMSQLASRFAPNLSKSLGSAMGGTPGLSSISNAWQGLPGAARSALGGAAVGGLGGLAMGAFDEDAAGQKHPLRSALTGALGGAALGGGAHLLMNQGGKINSDPLGAHERFKTETDATTSRANADISLLDDAEVQARAYRILPKTNPPSAAAGAGSAVVDRLNAGNAVPASVRQYLPTLDANPLRDTALGVGIGAMGPRALHDFRNPKSLGAVVNTPELGNFRGPDLGRVANAGLNDPENTALSASAKAALRTSYGADPAALARKIESIRQGHISTPTDREISQGLESFIAQSVKATVGPKEQVYRRWPFSNMTIGTNFEKIPGRFSGKGSLFGGAGGLAASLLAPLLYTRDPSSVNLANQIAARTAFYTAHPELINMRAQEAQLAQ